MYKITFVILCFSLLTISVAQQNIFTEVAENMGITHQERSERGGLSFYDFNNDGRDDLSITSDEGLPLSIFRNNGSSFENITDQLGLQETSLSRILLWADYDNDGDNDLFVGNEGAPNSFYRNEGNMNLVNATAEVGLPNLLSNSTNAACWGDYNNDGFLDIYVTNYSEYTGNDLYKNNGDGTFTEVTSIAGVEDKEENSEFYRMALAVSFIDYNYDGWQDIYIANDKYKRNTLYKNNGDGTFTDVSEETGADVNGFFMGIAIGDYNEDGYLDIYTTNDPPGNAMLKNNGDGTFTNVAQDLGLGVYKSCWGTNFLDFENDSDLDIYISVVGGSPVIKNPLFEHHGDGTYQLLENVGLEEEDKSYGNAIGDFDNNGYVDIAVFNIVSSTRLYKNLTNNSNNYIKLNLEGTQSNRDGIGSIIKFFMDGEELVRYTHNGISFCSQNSQTLTVGLGQSSVIDSIEVKWLSGIVDTYKNVEVNQLLNMTEGETLTDLKGDTNIPSEFKLKQNFPNPFNPATNITFTLPVSSDVTLKIFNILGQNIKTLFNSRLSAGEHAVNFNADEFNSGVYFYELYAEGINGSNFRNVKKMILSK